MSSVTHGTVLGPLLFSLYIHGNSNKIKSGIRSYLCFICFLYLYLYVLGDEAWIS